MTVISLPLEDLSDEHRTYQIRFISASGITNQTVRLSELEVEYLRNLLNHHHQEKFQEISHE